METKGKHKGNNRGVAVILVVGVLVFFLIFFLVVGIDFAYIYLARGELQNAADSSCLAGAAKVDPLLDNNAAAYLQTDARREAWKFACENKAAGESVYLVGGLGNDCNNPPANLNNSNAASGDIVVGHWRESSSTPTESCATGWQEAGSGFFCRSNGGTGLLVNAVKVVARRTESSPGGRVGLIFGGLVGWPLMNVSQVAVAANPAQAESPVSVCEDACTADFDPNGTLMYWAPYPSEVDPGQYGVAWTVFDENSQSTPTKELNEYLCGKIFNACNVSVYADNGSKNSVARQMRCAFYNPLYDSLNKTCADGLCDSATDTVTSWSPIVPVFEPDGCPPGAQPSPYEIVQYARLKILEVYASGGGGTNECACGAYDAPPLTGPTPNALLVNAINCVMCPEAEEELLGKRSVLVR